MKFSKSLLFFALMATCAVAAPARGKKASSVGAQGNQKLPITTASQAAARYFETGMVHYENHRWNFALTDWHEAVRLDPKFALAHAWISFTTTDPAEETKERTKAKSSLRDITPAELLLVRWMVDVHEDNYVEGITAMNDVLSKYPHDKRLNFLIAYWLFRQDQYEIAEKLTLRALADDPNYATAYNQLAYIYSRRGEYGKALEAAGKYAKLLPDQPNPHDSYGEMLRLSGRFAEALDEYRNALKIDPTFYISQKEIGETYSLMGDQKKARAEYAKAIHEAPSDGLMAEYLQKSALTYVREKKYKDADKAYLEAAENARSVGQWLWEARAYRVMAMYQPDNTAAMKSLQQAEAVLTAKKDVLAKADWDEERARILRVRVERIAISDEPAAWKAVAELEKMADSGGNSNIQRTFHGAEGALLVAQQKYGDAIPHLEEDFANPISMKLLVTCYRKTGATNDAAALSKKLVAWRIPGIEETLAVSNLRAQEGIQPGQN